MVARIQRFNPQRQLVGEHHVRLLKVGMQVLVTNGMHIKPTYTCNVFFTFHGRVQHHTHIRVERLRTQGQTEQQQESCSRVKRHHVGVVDKWVTNTPGLV